MKQICSEFYTVFWSTIKDVFPVVFLFLFFQYVVLRKSLPNPRKIMLGVIMVIVGLSLFLMGLDKALFPIGKIMATQLSSPEFLATSYFNPDGWMAYYWVYIFAAVIGFATAIEDLP